MNKSSIEICILAGGRGSRMRKDKTRLRLGRRTLLGHVSAAAASLALPVRIIRKDIVPRCGPLSGVLTALATTRMDTTLFLSCDMPFVSERLLRDLMMRFLSNKLAIFVSQDGMVGFPFLVRRQAKGFVEQSIAQKMFSLQALALTLTAQTLHLPSSRSHELLNINTPADFLHAKELWRNQLHRPVATALPHDTRRQRCRKVGREV